MRLRKTKIAVKGVNQNFKRLLDRVQSRTLAFVRCFLHRRLRLEPKFSKISQQAAENSEPILRGKTIEAQHHARVERGDVAVPDIARDAGEKNVRVAAFKR